MKSYFSKLAALFKLWGTILCHLVAALLPELSVSNEANRNFNLRLSSVTHLLVLLLPFRKTSDFPLLCYF